MNKMRLQIISPKRIIFDGECTMVEYNTTEGQVGVLAGHSAMTQVIAPGILTVYEENKEEPLKACIHSGIATIMPDLVSILAEVVEYKEEIDVSRAKEAYGRAKKRIEEKPNGYDWKRAKLALERAKARLELVGEKDV